MYVRRYWSGDRETSFERAPSPELNLASSGTSVRVGSSIHMMHVFRKVYGLDSRQQ